MALFSATCVRAGVPSAGDYDPTFGDGDGVVSRNLGPGSIGTGFALASDAQGRLILAGKSQAGESWPGEGCLALLRFTADGRYGPPHDSGFGTDDNGSTCLPGLLGNPYWSRDDLGLLVLPDGSILVSGVTDDSTLGELAFRPFVCRFLPDGIQDKTFGDNGCNIVAGVYAGQGLPARIVADGDTIYMAFTDGAKSTFGGPPSLMRFDLATGAIKKFGQDYAASFLPPGTTFERAHARDLVLTPDHDVIIVGNFQASVGKKMSTFVARFDVELQQPDLAFDGENDGDGLVILKYELPGEARSFDVIVRPSGRLLVAGKEYSQAQAQERLVITELMPDTGALSLDFNDGGAATISCGTPGICGIEDATLGLTASGAVVVGGTAIRPLGDSHGYYMFAARLHANGTPDLSFGPACNGMAFIDLGNDSQAARGMVLQGERVVLGGNADVATENGHEQQFALVGLSSSRLLCDGFEDTKP